ncbi:MAG: hypothetical protein OTI36_15410 [Beijerinckiaceae bacterium]|nr:hypothetical protein [Beijerinckiaceae bacterium]
MGSCVGEAHCGPAAHLRARRLGHHLVVERLGELLVRHAPGPRLGELAPRVALVTLAGAAMAAAGACAVQFFFRAQAKRTNFRRRQTSSRFATIAEAFVSITVAGAAGLAAAGYFAEATAPLVITVIVLFASRAMGKPAEGALA